MSKKTLIIFSLFILSCAFACDDNETVTRISNNSVVEKHGLIKVEGNKIVDEKSNPVVLRGMSLFWSQIKGKYYNYDCIKWLRDDWHCTIVRAAMGIETADGIEGYLVNKEEELNKIITVIDAAVDFGIYVIIDWHDHHAHLNQDEAVEFFKIIAEKYGDKPNIIYEIYNEPMQISWSEDVKPYAEEVISAIREIDPDNLIIVGTTTWSQDVDIAAEDPLDFDNIAYTLHFYASSHQSELRDKALRAMDMGAPLFVTEFGTSEYTGDGEVNTDSVKVWFDFMEQNNLSWCNWSITDKAESSAALKPGAGPNGNWSDSILTASGLIVKKKIMEGNKKYF